MKPALLSTGVGQSREARSVQHLGVAVMGGGSRPCYTHVFCIGLCALQHARRVLSHVDPPTIEPRPKSGATLARWSI